MAEVIEKQTARLNEQSDLLHEQSALLSEQSEVIKNLQAQLAWFKRQTFGKKSEKYAADNQPSLFSAEELGDITTTTPQAEVVETVVHRKTQKGVKKTRESWENLPVLETRVLEPKNVDTNRYRRIGEEVTYQVGFEPGKLFRIAIVRPKYGLIDSTEPVEKGQGVLIATMPLLPINKGIPSESLLAEILLQKYEYHLPFYRQIKQFAHLGMTGLKEATVAGWFKRTMELLRPLYNALVKEVFSSDYCQSDETTTPVIDNDRHQAVREYLWMTRAVQEKLVAFFYDDGSRAGQVIKDKADEHNFKGYLQCDGFGGYTAAFKPGCGVTLVNCMVHIRRHFLDAKPENPKAATMMLDQIKELYKIEHDCDFAGMTAEQRLVRRNLHSRPIMEKMKRWMETEGLRYSERSLIGKAVTYAYVRWNNMMNILKDGRLLLDNNLAENEIRPITLGRKNYLFCGNHEAAGNMCVITSLLATCRNHDINPRQYLQSIIAAMPNFAKATHEELLPLLPHRWKEYHPEAIMEKVRTLAK